MSEYLVVEAGRNVRIYFAEVRERGFSDPVSAGRRSAELELPTQVVAEDEPGRRRWLTPGEANEINRDRVRREENRR